jgi:hypothetical protein
MDQSEEVEYGGNLDMGEFMADNDADGLQDEDFSDDRCGRAGETDLAGPVAVEANQGAAETEGGE